MNDHRGQFLTTKQLPEFTGLSQSFFEKGRVYGYGPRYIRVKATSDRGKVLYRVKDVERWLASQEHDPEGRGDD